MIEVKNLYLNYIKEYSALYNINLTVQDNERVALIGDNESGKTSLLRCICGLENYNKGEIYLDKTNLKKADFKNDINLIYLSSNPVFFNSKSVYSNLAYSLKIRNYSETMINQKINRALDVLGIEGLKERKIKTLTKNEKIIVNIARSILREADIYLVDDIFCFDNLTNEKIANVLSNAFHEKASIIFALDIKNANLTKTLNVNRTITITNGSLGS